MPQLLYDYLRVGNAWKASRTEDVAKAPNLVPMDVDYVHCKSGKGKKRVKARMKTTETDPTAKAKTEQPDSDTLTCIATSVVSLDTTRLCRQKQILQRHV